MRWPRLHRGRHRPTKTEPYRPAFSYRPTTYPLPLVETWEACRVYNHQPPSTWQQLLTWVRRG